MMESGVDRLMVLMILADMGLLGLGQPATAIGLIAFQGMVLGALAIVAHDVWSARVLLIALIGIGLRGVLFPLLLRRVVRRAGIGYEHRPLVGYAASLLIGIALLGGAMAVGGRLPLHATPAFRLVMPASLFTMFTGLFLIVGRRKALTQCLGYLVLENGIYGFGVVAVGEVPALVELGALLDLLVAVMVMGVAMFRLSEEFDHMDTDQLTLLQG